MTVQVRNVRSFSTTELKSDMVGAEDSKDHDYQLNRDERECYNIYSFEKGAFELVQLVLAAW